MEQKIKAGKPDRWQGRTLYRKRQKRHIFPSFKNHTLCYMLFVAAAFVFCGCQSTDKDTHLTAEEAKTIRHDFLHKIQTKNEVGTEELISLVKEWKRIDKAVSDGSAPDTADFHTAHVSKDHIVWNDSVRSQMRRLIDSRQRRLSDYLTVVQNLNSIETDTVSMRLVSSVHRLYRKAGTAGIYKGSGKEAVRNYNRLLEDVLRKGIHNRQEVFGFLMEEDVAFRSFLHHLPVISGGDIPMGGITRNTGTVIRRIIGLADSVPPVLEKPEAVILLTMRNNRRLLQNAAACVEDLEVLRIKDDGQAAAYLWMILQPWITFDGLAYALMDEGEWRQLEEIAVKTPGALSKLKVEGSPFDISTLPVLLIETFILG